MLIKKRFAYPVTKGLPLVDTYGHPEVPYYTELVLLPFGHKVTSVSVTGEYKQISDIFITAALEDIP